MVEFTDGEYSKSDNFFVTEDPTRVHRGIKDLLVNELNVDRIDEGKNEFNVAKPKDKLKIYAYKEKSPHTLVEYNFGLSIGSPKKIFQMEHGDEVLLAELSSSCKVISFYPGRNKEAWLPGPVTTSNPMGGGLNAEHESRWEKSKPYKVLASLWHDKIYSKEISRYSSEAKNNCLRIHDIIRERFGVQRTIGAKGTNRYKPKWGETS